MKKVFALLLASLLLTACATAGTKFDFSQARQIRVGMTEQEVVQIMGKPMSVTARGQSQVWVWSYAKAGAFSVKFSLEITTKSFAEAVLFSLVLLSIEAIST